jgi:hypothetical protein
MRTPAALLLGLLAALPPLAAAHPNPVAGPPHPARNPASRVMLAVPGLPTDSHAIDFARLPRR